MVNSVGAPYSYLGQLQAHSTAPKAPASTPAGTQAAAAQNANAASLVSSLLSGGSFAPAILSLLQPDSNGDFNPISTLLDGPSTNNAMTGLLNNLFTTVASSSFNKAFANGSAQAAAQTLTQKSPVQNLLNDLNKAAIAYNQANLQNSMKTINANSYQADGVTPLVA